MAEHASDGAQVAFPEIDPSEEEPVSPAPEPLRAVRVRYSLPLTESLSLEEARLAVVNFIFAKKHHGRFILRVDRMQGPAVEDPSPAPYGTLRMTRVS